MDGNRLVICPVHNEQDSIKHFREKLGEFYSGDVLFIDDGSTDGSREILDAIRDTGTTVIRHPERRGYGAALLTGFSHVRGNGYGKIVTIDVDLQHRPEHLPSFFDALDRRDAVLGSRYIRIDNYLDIPRTRLLINRYVSRLMEQLFSVRFSDPFCGYRGYTGAFLKEARLSEPSYGMGLEILMELLRTGVSHEEIPIEALYPDKCRKFLDGLDDPRLRLLHYLSVVARKRSEIG